VQGKPLRVSSSSPLTSAASSEFEKSFPRRWRAGTPITPRLAHLLAKLAGHEIYLRQSSSNERMRPATSSRAYGFGKKASSGMSPEETAASPFPEVTNTWMPG
jgi:hypothetical protein